MDLTVGNKTQDVRVRYLKDLSLLEGNQGDLYPHHRRNNEDTRRSNEVTRVKQRSYESVKGCNREKQLYRSYQNKRT